MFVWLVMVAAGVGFAGERASAGVERAASLGLKQIWMDDARYTYQLPADLETEETLTEGALTWHYQGQAIFWHRGERPVSYENVVPDRILTGLGEDPDVYLGVGTTRVDRYGRSWVLESIDLEAAYAAVAAYDALVLETFGAEPDVADNEGVSYPEDAGETRVTTPYSWSGEDCYGDSTWEISEHSSDDLDPVPDPMTEQQRKIVFLHNMTENNLLCSGVMVDTRWVLTAAHCVADESGYFDPDDYDVCTRENLQEGANCFGVDTMVTPGGTYDGDVEDDYAVVKLDAAPGEGWMAISTASDGTISSYTNFHRAYPGLTDGCVDNLDYTIGEEVIEGPPEVRMYKADGDIQSTPSGRVRFNISSAVGMSGGPFFYCPNGPCEDGHWVTSIMSTPNIWWFFGYTGYMEGPKGSDFRTWVINHTP